MSRKPEYIYRPRIKNEEKELRQRATIFGAIAFVIIVAMVFYGPSVLVGIGSFWETLNPSKSAPLPTQQDADVEIPPHVEPLPQFTNNDKIEIKGSGQSGHTIEVIVNGEKVGETIVGSDNQFNILNINLTLGDNKIDVYSKNTEGKQSTATSLNITYDKKAPKLELNPPNTDTSLAKETTQVTISGSS